ncbi:protein-tyrosine phosphatase family protein [Actinokineospora bangkokensis]|uniref:Protein phosphatase n=1 Tax=Actinokineospora bangkokensis TaxID=1193682 RepID=A0A1Q9LK69_9PSEU|nr:protein-tyrosine phosphatase family protein [Actinokineospora bangkokensis]OLR92428.1 protein phosphatase [Actinokineospora bangkokensis]
MTWDPTAEGVLRLPSGRLVRGRGLRAPLPPGPTPDFAVYLLGRTPPDTPWRSHWVRWPDFWLPTDPTSLTAALTEALDRSTTERVELACAGGVGRTGTALACLAILDGTPPPDAVAYVRAHYRPHAVETPWQKRFVARYTPPAH